MTVIDLNHITFNDDGAAWWVVNPDDVVVGVVKMADRVCDTCYGLGVIPFTNDITAEQDCPDCIDGRHTFEIEVETATVVTDRDGLSETSHCPDFGCGSPRNSLHAKGCNRNDHRTLRVSVVPGMVLPIVTARQYRQDMSLRVPFVIAYSDGTTSVSPLPDDARPGMWGVKLKVQKKDIL